MLKNIGCARRICYHIYIFILNFESAFYHELGNKSSNLIFFLSKIVGMVSGGKEKLLSASASVALLYPRTRMGGGSRVYFQLHLPTLRMIHEQPPKGLSVLILNSIDSQT